MNQAVTHRGVSRWVAIVGFALGWSSLAALGWCSLAAAQIAPEAFVTGAARDGWDKWQAAMRVVLQRDANAAEKGFAELLALDPSPFRIALLAEKTVMQTAEAGGVLLFEQDIGAGALGENGKKVADLLRTGREQMNEADDGYYFANLGRFDVSNANLRALAASNPDPVAVLEFTERVPRRREILTQISANPTVGEAARDVLRLLDLGERKIKADPLRIKENIERLGGPPRAFENGLAALKDSGEYAVPFIVQYLRDPSKVALSEPILKALPLISRPALNPLVISLKMSDQATKPYLIRALGHIGYGQALPYLLQLKESGATSSEVLNAVNSALAELESKGVPVRGITAAEAFLKLAEDYYDNNKELSADPRLDAASVWYWRGDLLVNLEVPTPIFNEVMTMRCCEESLLLNPDYREPLALWLAADFRREAQLPDGQTDITRPANYPPAIYFAQSAGAEHDLMTLARAIDDSDPAVALGAIEALRKTAGPASILGDATGRQPLAEALSFPDRMVRIRAGLALGGSLPEQPFRNYQNLMPVLNEALLLHGGARNAVVVDPDSKTANGVVAGLRANGYEVVSDATLYAALEKVRHDMPGVDVIFLASDMSSPNLQGAIADLRSEFRFAATPLVIIAKQGDREAVRDRVRADQLLSQVMADDGPEQVQASIKAVAKSVGAQAITAESGRKLALEAAQVLRLLALTRNSVFDVAAAEPALLEALNDPDSDLRLTVAQVLGFLGSNAAQDAIAKIALNSSEEQSMRVAMFAALAEAAKRRGNHLSGGLLSQLISLVENEPDLTIREAASRTLGALNVPGNPASQIIRNQHNG